MKKDIDIGYDPELIQRAKRIFDSSRNELKPNEKLFIQNVYMGKVTEPTIPQLNFLNYIEKKY